MNSTGLTSRVSYPIKKLPLVNISVYVTHGSEIRSQRSEDGGQRSEVTRLRQDYGAPGTSDTRFRSQRSEGRIGQSTPLNCSIVRDYSTIQRITWPLPACN